jgi:hypothetical protein
MTNHLATRRECLAGVLGAVFAFEIKGQERQFDDSAARDCVQCGGVGRVPRAGAKPWVWTEGQAPPKWADVLGEAWCPVCQADARPADLTDELNRQFDAALENHRVWEERTGFKLQCVLTRHAALHTQLPTKQAREVGNALEKLTLHLKQTTGSLKIVPTRPNQYELILLLEKSSWDAFRKVMEGLYTPQQLGEAWFAAQRLNAYDHVVTPHLYETKETLRTRPPSCGTTFLLARRLMTVATNRRSPLWLSEGFAGYSDFLVHGINRWGSVYAGEQIPVGDWLEQARLLAVGGKSLAWADVFQSELRDWRDQHHYQTVAMVAFLFETEPARFLRFLGRLKAKEKITDALETAYSSPLAVLETRWTDWLASGRRRGSYRQQQQPPGKFPS